ncbi:MAG: stage II sporulation protein M [Anaerolineales bacterium]|nr:stage II sporulation protein M [Anaerolineales bacterium]
MAWFAPVWLVTKRELRDQLRDWRILFPLAILTLIFPLLMNEVARSAVEFVSQYGGTLLVDRLVPFSVLIIGFFPITISLVVALESFVGEKERGTIEPLLSTPLKDWHMYVGKLLIGVLTPLLASLVAIGFYLVIVSRQRIEMPELSVLIQLLALTIAHAVLMVSAAIVISVQSTSVKAANLLASFIVIPVAVLMQGESALLFWGNNQVLWLAVAGVLILAGLLIRVGLSHFQREYLLGREIDVLNLLWIWRTFWGYFKGEAKSLGSWYMVEIRRALRHLWLPVSVLLLLAVITLWAGFQWTVTTVPELVDLTSSDAIRELSDRFEGSTTLVGIGQQFSASFIFAHNVRAIGLILLAGLVSFSVLGMLVYIVNLSTVGALLGVFQLLGYSPVTLAVYGLLPHGIFEVPALILASAAMLRIGVVLVTPQVGRSMGEVVLELLADWTKVAIGLVLPMLLIAALIETYVTPALLASAF